MVLSLEKSCMAILAQKILRLINDMDTIFCFPLSIIGHKCADEFKNCDTIQLRQNQIIVLRAWVKKMPPRIQEQLFHQVQHSIQYSTSDVNPNTKYHEPDYYDHTYVEP